MSERPRKRPTRDSLSLESVITAKALRGLFKRKILRSHLTMPGTKELRELTRILNVWRDHFIYEQQAQPFEKLKRKALKEIDTIDDIFCKLRSNILDLSQTAPLGIRSTLNRRLQEINEARQSLAMARYSSFLEPGGIGADRGWQWLAKAFPTDFYDAMAPRNPELKRGIGSDGPLVRFIAAVVPLISGEHPTPGSVAVQLKKLRKAGEISIGLTR